MSAADAPGAPDGGPAAVLAARTRLRRPWSLRRRLVLGVTALLAVLAIAIGGTSVGILHQQLVDRLDSQLTDSARGAGGQSNPGGPQNGSGSTGGATGFDPCSASPSGTPTLDFLLRGQGRGAVRLLVCDGTTVIEGYFDPGGASKRLTSSQLATLVAVPSNDDPRTVSLGALGDYRVVSRELTSGAVIVTALPMSDVQSTTAQLSIIIGALTLLAIALAVVLGLFVVNVALRPLTRVTATATRVSELPLEDEARVGQRVPEGDAQPTTEVGRVGQALNRLLDRVESALQARTASENKLRRFVADASHELRTPLASIRGYSELSRRYDDELPEDVRHSLDRISSESVRMTGLVEDLLLLARLDSGSPIVHEPVDLAPLLVDAVSDAHAASPDHEWALELPADAGGDDAPLDEAEAAEPIRVLGDARSLQQVVVNLLANARTHTPEGTHVVVRLAATDDDAIVEVEDDGPGISETVRDSLFERFVRADDSRSRAQGSTGLGLSIVQAIVRAHDGAIAVESEPGRTVFRVTLPLDPYAD